MADVVQSRRSFGMQLTTLSVVGLTSYPCASARVASPREITAEYFTPLIGNRFAATDERAKVIEITLQEVSTLKARRALLASGPRRQPFSLTFTHNSPAVPEHGCFRINHPAFGGLAVFMSIVEGKWLLEAIFA